MYIDVYIKGVVTFLCLWKKRKMVKCSAVENLQNFNKIFAHLDSFVSRSQTMPRSS